MERRRGRLVRVALIHDWLTGMRGGEKALEVFCEIFPDADLFTLVHLPGTRPPLIEQRRSRHSPIQWLPLAGKLYRQYLPLFPMAVEQFDLDGYDLVISTSHCAAKSVVVTGRARHLCYCLTPDALRLGPVRRLLRAGTGRQTSASALLRPVLAGLARWDRATEGRVHRYLAISQYVARRIALYYNRQSTLVYPPVDTEFYTPDAGMCRPSLAALTAQISRGVSARALQAGGSGHDGGAPSRRRLDRRRQRPRARQPRTPDRRRHRVGRLAVRRRDSRALSHLASRPSCPGEEDFGIVPVEAQACGRPVVALGPRRRARYRDRRRDRRAVRRHDRRLARGGTATRRGIAVGLRRASARHAETVFTARGSSPRFNTSWTTRWRAPAERDGKAPQPAARRLPRRHRRGARRWSRSSLAYLLRFETGLIAITRGHPPIEQYLNVLPFIALIVPLGFHFQGLYRLRRGRSRIDDFFNVLVGSIFAVVLGIVATLYFQAYYASDAQRDVGAFEVSRTGLGHVPGRCNIALGYLSRKFIREALERRWLAGIGLRSILIAGAGDLGRVVADRILEHRELGYQIVGFVDDKAGGDHLGYRGLPLLGSLSDAAEIVSQREDRRPLRGAAARGAHEAARPGRVDQPRRRRRQGRARPAAVHRAARAARGSRRRAGHQPQRRAAAGRQRVHQARRSTS